MHRMRIRGNNHGAWPCESLFYYDLISDPPSRRIKAEAMFSSECLYLGIFVQIGRAGVLNVVIQTDNGLLRIVNPCGSHRPELMRHRRSVVVSHTMLWATSKCSRHSEQAFLQGGQLRNVVQSFP